MVKSKLKVKKAKRPRSPRQGPDIIILGRKCKYHYKDFYNFKKQFDKKGDHVVLTESEFWSWTRRVFMSARQVNMDVFKGDK